MPFFFTEKIRFRPKIFFEFPRELSFMPRTPKALALISGGLDSLLAARVVRDLGVDVTGISFDSGFFHLGQPGSRTDAGGHMHPWVARLENVAAQARIPLEIIDVSREFFQMLLNPAHGYGSHVNPCIDCKILFLSRARQRLAELGGDFLITGEVSGQRPMSQNLTALDLIERRSGCHDILLRPLSAKVLAPIRAEREGLVNRDRLYGFSGRTRKPQLELAAQLGITEFAQPAGGCVLTEEVFGLRFADFRKHTDLTQAVSHAEITRLRLGRHFRLGSGAKVIVGRNEAENDWLERERGNWGMVFPHTCKGPVGLISSPWTPADRDFLFGAVARYSDAPRGEQVELEWTQAGSVEILSAVAINDEVLLAARI
jgi:tRNA U34 2-thiouridine synthase MnmA/TrmU